MSPKHLLAYAAVAFVLFFMIKNPHGAEHVVSNIGNFFLDSL